MPTQPVNFDDLGAVSVSAPPPVAQPQSASQQQSQSAQSQPTQKPLDFSDLGATTVSAPQQSQQQTQQPPPKPSLFHSIVQSTMENLTGGIQEIGQEIKGWSELPHLFRNPETPDEMKVAKATGSPLTLATYRIGKAFIDKLQEATAARQKARETGEGFAGQTMATLENYPLVGDLVQQYEQGQPGTFGKAAVRTASTVLGPKVIGKAAEGIASIAPKTAQIAGEDVPVLASQTGAKGAKATEALAKTSEGGRAQLANFAEDQQAASQRALGNVADRTAKNAISDLDAAKPIQANRVLSKATDFSEAADQLKGAAKEYFSDIDKSTNGEFAKLQGERSDILKALRRTDKFNDMQDLRNELAEVQVREDALFNKYSLNATDKAALASARKAWKQGVAMEELGERIKASTSGVPADVSPLKTTTGEAIEQSAETVSGTKLSKQLRSMDSNTLDTALGGNAAHRNILFNLADLIATGDNAAKVGRILGWIRAAKVGSGAAGLFTHTGAVLGGEAALESGGSLLGAILTKPRIATTLFQGLKAGRAVPAIGASLAYYLDNPDGATKPQQ
jgi:hypothetical protein